MTWNGSGLYERLYNWVTDRDAATPIDATKMDAEQDGIVGALNDLVQQNEPFQGPILAQDGTVSSPGYTFDSDLDLGMYRVGVNSGALVAGSAAPLTWTATKVVLLGLDIDTIAESTPAAGVTIDGVLLKDGGLEATGTITGDTIAEKTPAAGVTIDSVLLKDGGLEATGTITTDTIAEKTPAAGVTIDGLLIKDSSIKLDALAESTPAAGVTVDGLLIKDGALGTSSSVPTAAIADDAVTTAKIADANVTTAKIADDAVTLAKLAAGTDGELITWDAAGDPAVVAVGTATHVLTSNGVGLAPTFQAASVSAGAIDTAKLADDAVTLAKMAAGTDGELITWDAAGDPAVVAVGTAGEVLTSNGAGAAPTFQAVESLLGIAAGGVGSVALARCRDTSVAFGSTTAASNLNPAGYSEDDLDNLGIEISGSLSGTWKCLGYSANGIGTTNSLTLWIRTV